MRNRAILNKRGFSLLEVSIALFLLLFFVGVISAVQGRVVAAQGAHTMVEMQTILDSARQFYLQNNRWPNSMTELQTFWPKIKTNNVFGNPYNVATSVSGSTFTVNTVVPYKSMNVIKSGRFVVISDTGSANLVQLSATLPMDTKIGWLQYEQTWVH